MHIFQDLGVPISSIFLWTLLPQVLTFLDKSKASNPCSYPNPSDKRYHSLCHTLYLGRDNFCDPMAVFSRTESDLVMENLDANFSSCIKDHHEYIDKYYHRRRWIKPAKTIQLHKDYEEQRYTMAVAVIPLASINSSLDGTLVYGCSFKMLKHVHLSLDRQIEFVRILARQWEGRCKADLFIAVVLDWDWTVGVPPSPTLIPLFQHKLQKLANWPVLQPVNIIDAFPALLKFSFEIKKIMSEPLLKMQLEGLATSIFNPSLMFQQPHENMYKKLAIPPGVTPIESKQARAKRIRLQGRTIPNWAITVAVVCILLAFFGVVCGTFVTKIPLKKTAAQRGMPQVGSVVVSNSPGSTIKQARSRFRAGFGGGFFGARNRDKMEANTANPRSINMMKSLNLKRPGPGQSGASKTSTFL